MTLKIEDERKREVYKRNIVGGRHNSVTVVIRAIYLKQSIAE